MAERKSTDTGSRLGDWLSDCILRSLIWMVLRLPYAQRVRFMGWFMARVAAPLAGWNKRIRANLAYVMPDLPKEEVEQLVRDVPNNIGRSVIEMYSGDAFMARCADIPWTGEGARPLEQALSEGRPVILVTGHFGNYNVPRAALRARGYPVGGLYNPMKNTYVNMHYIGAMSAIGAPMFERGRRGFAGMLKHLRGGGAMGILIDQFMAHGAPLSFFGKTAPTALSAAEMALKYNALIVPMYGVRKPDGLSFDIIVDAPIPHTDPETMTQALNDNLEALVRKYLGQWFWIHRRWKPEKQAEIAARKARKQARATTST